jgi:hypothetical protein
MRLPHKSAIALLAGLTTLGLTAPLSSSLHAMPLLAQITTTDQVDDISPSDPFYPAVERLIEQFGIDLTLADGSFQGEEILTYGEFALGLNQALDSLDRMGWTPPPAPAAFAFGTESVDVERTSAYFEAVELLNVRYGVNLAADGDFDGDRPILQSEVVDYVNQATGVSLSGADETLTRGEFAIFLDQLMNQALAGM